MQVGHKVFLDECPALAGLGCGNLAGTGLGLYRNGMHFEERGGLFKIKRLHHAHPTAYGTHGYRPLKPWSVP